jgi:hypothetical protein
LHDLVLYNDLMRRYPHALFFLDLLQDSTFRRNMSQLQHAEYVARLQVNNSHHALLSLLEMYMRLEIRISSFALRIA